MDSDFAKAVKEVDYKINRTNPHLEQLIMIRFQIEKLKSREVKESEESFIRLLKMEMDAESNLFNIIGFNHIKINKE